MILLVPQHLTCEFKTDPRAVDALRPRLSWTLESPRRGESQKAYRVWVARSPQALAQDKGDLWDSGRVASGQSVAVPYGGAALKSGERCYWKVQVWDKDGQPSPTTGPTAFWQMGLLQASDWKARWISARVTRNAPVDGLVLPPCPYLRKTFTLAKPVKTATLFVTARGLYEMRLNGAKVGDEVLAPGWTDYHKRVQYQAYDVTAQLHPGENAMGAILGDGWYSGYVGFGHKRDLYGNRTALLAQLDIEYTDGTRQTVGSDGTWRAATGAVAHSDLLQGESYDARQEPSGWDRPGFADAAWQRVTIDARPDAAHAQQVDVTDAVKAHVNNETLSVVAGNDLGGDPAYLTPKQLRVEYTLAGTPHAQTVDEKQTLTIPAPGETSGPLVIRRAVYGALSAPASASAPPMLVGTHGPLVRVTQNLTPRAVTQPTPGTYIFDLRQNMVGWARLRVSAPAGTPIRLRFGEMLNPDGTLYTANLRAARATDTYTCRGGGRAEVWEPHFTFHGFRYVEMTGYPGKPTADMITGRVVGSDIPPAGTFACSAPMVNQLQHNIVWSQRGNFLSIPTDCPQRDERLGWMGDAQIFARTATLNRDVAAFYEKWIQDVEDAQSSAGGYSDVSPRLVDLKDGAPAWGDAGVIVPWTVWQAYGDTALLQKHWPSMVAWMDYLTSANPDGLWKNHRNGDYGDWLSVGADTPKDVLATAYYAHDAALMAQMARALGRASEAARYDALLAHIKTAFNTAFVQPDGTIQGDTQTVYVLALHFDLLPPALRPLAARHLAAAIAAKNDHLSTGFVGVGYLCPTLTDMGRNDLAYKLLLNDTFPSWGYSIKQGATTIWERWDGYTQDKGFQDPAMNSFNHYSLGSVGEWLYRYVAGIDGDPAHPGFARLVIQPHPGPGLTSARATYDSIRGHIVSGWQTAKDGTTFDVTIPANTTATVLLPTPAGAVVTEGGHPAAQAEGVSSLRRDGDVTVLTIGSGEYRFEVQRTQE